MYNLYTDRIVDKWGPLSVANVTVREICAFGDLYRDTPELANKLVTMRRTHRFRNSARVHRSQSGR